MGDVTFRLSAGTVIIHDNDHNDRFSRGDTVEIIRNSGSASAHTTSTTTYSGFAANRQLRDLGVRPSYATQFAPLRAISTHLDNAWAAYRGHASDRFEVIQRESLEVRRLMFSNHVTTGFGALRLWEPANYLLRYASNGLRTQRTATLDRESLSIMTSIANGSLRGENAIRRLQALLTQAASYGMSNHQGLIDAENLLRAVNQAGRNIEGIRNGTPNAEEDFTSNSGVIQTLVTRYSLRSDRLEELNRQRITARVGSR